MPKWITTTSYIIDYGWKHEKKVGWVSPNTELFFTPHDNLLKELNKLVTYLDSHQYTIKAVTPMTQGLACYDHKDRTGSNWGYGWGWGYGVTPITGFIVLAQHEREVSFEQYECLLKAQNLKKTTLPPLKEKLERLQRAVDTDKKKALEVCEKKSMFGKAKYLIDKNEFDSKEMAELALATMRQECSARCAELEEIQAQLLRLEDEIKALEA